ncbi:unnamed protein product [Lota lota]
MSFLMDDILDDDDDYNAGVPVKKKRVVFADSKGLSLTAVRLFSEDPDSEHSSHRPSLQRLGALFTPVLSEEDRCSCPLSTSRHPASAGVQQGFSRASAGLQQGFSWASAGLQLGFSRASAGLQLGFSWASAGLQQGFSWASAGLQLGFSWASAGLQLGFSWASAGLQLGFSRASAGLQLGFSRASAGLQQGFSWASAGLQLGFSSRQQTSRPSAVSWPRAWWCWRADGVHSPPRVQNTSFHKDVRAGFLAELQTRAVQTSFNVP